MNSINKITTTSIFCLFMIAGLLMTSYTVQGQEKTDSVIVNVGHSKIIFVINDPKDLKLMEDYDINAIVGNLNARFNGDSTATSDTTIVVDNNEDDSDENQTAETNNDKRKSHDKKDQKSGKLGFLEIGTNNYLGNGKFPDADNAPYSVRPWGSWYVALNSVYRSHIAGPVFIESGIGVSWYNFKFENDMIRVTDTDQRVAFAEDTRFPDASFKKSKLTVAYINASLVPVVNFGRESKSRWNWSDHSEKNAFRFGVGGYAGFRIGSYSKLVYEEDDDKRKKRNHDNYSLENFRYGVRVQLGLGATDLFFNYDLNELFIENKGPKLNAFSFGLIL